MAYAGKKNPSRTSDSALSTLPLLVYMAMAIGMMLADHRGGYGILARQQLSVLTEPFRWLAASPTQLFRSATETLAFRSQLLEENERRRRDLSVAIARIHRLNAVAEENFRLRKLLGGTRGYTLSVRMVGIVDIDLDPFRQRLVLDAGSDNAVKVGQALIDSGGVLGQVVEVTRNRAIALLVTDPDHAVPVQVARSGLRTIAYGTGHADTLSLPNIPQSADIRPGDVLITSGIGGRFPAGFPVGVVTRVHADQLRLFVIADAQPAAHLERGNEVLLINDLAPAVDVGPPAPPGRAPQPGPALAPTSAPATAIERAKHGLATGKAAPAAKVAKPRVPGTGR